MVLGENGFTGIVFESLNKVELVVQAIKTSQYETSIYSDLVNVVKILQHNRPYKYIDDELLSKLKIQPC